MIYLYFIFINDNELTNAMAGVLAQELMETIPEAVRVRGNIKLPNGDEIRDFLYVNKVGSSLSENTSTS